MIRLLPPHAALFFSLAVAALCVPSDVRAAACLEWDLSQRPTWYLAQGIPIKVALKFQQHGTDLTVSGSWYSVDGDPDFRSPETGTGSGQIHRNSVTFTMNWKRGVAGKYAGVIADDGSFSGNTVNKTETASATWTAPNQKAVCVKWQTDVPAASPVLPPKSCPQGQAVHNGQCAPIVKVLGQVTAARDDVDVYDSPVLPRHVIGIFAAGRKAKVLARHPDGWCKLQGVAKSGGDGWVAYDHLTNCPAPKG